MEHLTSSYFKSKIAEHIKTFFPEIAIYQPNELVDIINYRTTRALEVYEEQTLDGIQPFYALEAALTELKKDLLFSKYAHINTLLIEEFPEFYDRLVEKGKLQQFTIMLIKEAEAIYSKYDISDEFVYNDILDNEIKELINKKIIK